MKKLILITIPLLLFACDTTEQYRQPIEELTTQWAETTTMLTEFVENLNSENTELAKIKEEYKEYTLSKSELKELGYVFGNRYEEIQNTTGKAIQDYFQFNKEMVIVLDEWSKQTELLDDLKAGLNSGELDDNTQNKIDQLKMVRTMVNAELAQWKDAAAERKAEVEKMMGQLKTLHVDIPKG